MVSAQKSSVYIKSLVQNCYSEIVRVPLYRTFCVDKIAWHSCRYKVLLVSSTHSEQGWVLSISPIQVLKTNYSLYNERVSIFKMG